MKVQTINIHGKEYVPVSERIKLVHDGEAKLNITTEVIPHDTVVIIKATVTTKKGIFTGISAANPAKAIEKASPYEVAETSAVGRALAFAGFGVIDSISSADEVRKAINVKGSESETFKKDEDIDEGTDNQDRCPHCGSTNKYHAKTCPNFDK